MPGGRARFGCSYLVSVISGPRSNGLGVVVDDDGRAVGVVDQGAVAEALRS